MASSLCRYNYYFINIILQVTSKTSSPETLLSDLTPVFKLAMLYFCYFYLSILIKLLFFITFVVVVFDLFFVIDPCLQHASVNFLQLTILYFFY